MKLLFICPQLKHISEHHDLTAFALSHKVCGSHHGLGICIVGIIHYKESVGIVRTASALYGSGCFYALRDRKYIHPGFKTCYTCS